MDKPLRMPPAKGMWGIRERVKVLRIATRLHLPFGRSGKPAGAMGSSNNRAPSTVSNQTCAIHDLQTALGLEILPVTTSSGTDLERIKLLSLLCPSCKHPHLFNVKQPRLSHLLVCPECQTPFTSRLVLIRSMQSTRTKHYRDYSVRAVDELGVEHLFEFLDHKNGALIEMNSGDLVSIAYIGDWPVTVENFHLGRFWVLSDTPRVVKRRRLLSVAALAALVLVLALGIGVGTILRNGSLTFSGTPFESAFTHIINIGKPAMTTDATPAAERAYGVLGDTATLDGYSLTVTGLQQGVDLGGSHTAAPGMKLIALGLQVVNVSNAKGLSVTPLNFAMLDAIGNKYPVQIGGCKDQMITKDLAPGDSLRGCVAFEVPLATVPTAVQYPVELNPRVEIQASAIR
jgi:uncharacterized protein YbaR (Trm112 family)